MWSPAWRWRKHSADEVKVFRKTSNQTGFHCRWSSVCVGSCLTLTRASEEFVSEMSAQSPTLTENTGGPAMCRHVGSFGFSAAYKCLHKQAKGEGTCCQLLACGRKSLSSEQIFTNRTCSCRQQHMTLSHMGLCCCWMDRSSWTLICSGVECTLQHDAIKLIPVLRCRKNVFPFRTHRR